MAMSTRRRWLRPPQLRTLDADLDERYATWLELFFDLVFVISIAEVVHTLEDYHTLSDFLGTAGLFVAVWWAWVGYTVYADRFDTDDLLHRVLVLAGMLAVIAMALSIHDALYGGSARFALAFVAVRGILLLLNARARRHAAAARPLRPLGGGADPGAVRPLGRPPSDREGPDPRQPPGGAVRVVHPDRGR